MSFEPIRQRADRLRATPLKGVLLAAGAQPDPLDKAKWHTARGVLSVTGVKFINWNQGFGGGGAIDLAMHLKRVGFIDAIDWLDRRFSAPHPAPPTTSPSRRPLALPVPVANRLSAVEHYLIAQRHLPCSHLRPLIDSGQLYADDRANAVFLLCDERNSPVGAELRGTGPRPWRGMAPGSRKDTGYFAIGTPCPHGLILCESAIDAISCLVLHPGRRCISTSGARAHPRWLPDLIACGLPVYCGFDADPTGETMARAMRARHPAVQRLRPPHHDWNDTLCATSCSP